MKTRECNCNVRRGKTQCNNFGGEINDNGETTVCRLARRQEQSRQALERQRNEAPAINKELETREILSEIINYLLDFSSTDQKYERLELLKERIHRVLYE